MDRRDFMGAAAAAAVTPSLARTLGASAPSDDKPFGADFAPHFGMFGAHAGSDVVAQLEWMHERGFRSLEDNGMRDRPVAEQERIAATMSRLGMRMGVFVVNPATAFGKVTFAGGDKAFAESFLTDVRESVTVAKRVNAKWMTVVMGEVAPRLEPEYQAAYSIEILRQASAILEPHGLVMVLEPLNRRDHPSLFLTRVPQAYQICRAVNSPACKVLFDIYHQQITEGNIIPNFDRAWSEIAYVQIGDNPGRKEPGTGEINYANIFAHLKKKGYTGVLGMEHGNSKPGKEGELAVVEAYRKTDPA